MFSVVEHVVSGAFEKSMWKFQEVGCIRVKFKLEFKARVKKY